MLFVYLHFNSQNKINKINPVCHNSCPAKFRMTPQQVCGYECGTMVYVCVCVCVCVCEDWMTHWLYILTLMYQWERNSGSLINNCSVSTMNPVEVLHFWYTVSKRLITPSLGTRSGCGAFAYKKKCNQRKFSFCSSTIRQFLVHK